MNNINEMIELLAQKGEHPRKTILAEMKRTGKKAVGCFPIYAPEEIVHAAGFLPVGMWGGQTEFKLADKYLQSFCCSIMRANLEQGMAGVYDFLTAVIIPLYCDTLKCIGENWKLAVPHVAEIEMVYPQNRKISAGRAYMVEEFERVASEIEKLSGKKITEEEMLASLTVYDSWRLEMQRFVAVAGNYPLRIPAEKRHNILKAGYFMDKAEHGKLVKEITDSLETLPIETKGFKKVVLTGLLAEPSTFLNAFSLHNMAIVGDDLAQESRQFRVLNGKEGTAFARMAERIANQDGCAFLFDADKPRGKMLIQMAKELDADGIVVCQMKFCDPEEFDYPIYKKEIEASEIPLLYIEIDQQLQSVEQIRTRLQGFEEMLGCV